MDRFGSRRADAEAMDEKDFKKHLRDLAHGQHHPEEHDWSSEPGKAKAPATAKARKPAVKTAARKTRRASK
ncbi:MAG TPA: hypothetical protein VGH38_18950 [Bryobacteraceae bacterium]|jgi:hypothetical protein